MNELQKKLLTIIDYFDGFCKKHDIIYCLMGGSALGCARHKGFIPWDDDIDVFVSYNDYLKLIKYSSEISNDGFCLQEIRSAENELYIAKLRLKGTFIVEKNKTVKSDACNGIFIDIMILYNSPSNIISKLNMFLSAKILSANSLSRSGYKTKSKFKKMFMAFSSRLIKKHGEKFYFSKIIKYNEKETKLVCHIFGRASFKKSFYKRKWFDSTTIMPFENLCLKMPIGYDEYLICRYGSKYMEMPSKKVIDSYPPHVAYVNLNSEKDER